MQASRTAINQSFIQTNQSFIQTRTVNRRDITSTHVQPHPKPTDWYSRLLGVTHFLLGVTNVGCQFQDFVEI